MVLGNTRPEDPTKVSMPRPWHQSMTACGGKARIAGSSIGRAGP